MLCADAAPITATPQPECVAVYVKGTRAAAGVHVDEDGMFFLQARGLPPAQARDMLLHAFAGEVLGEISVPELRVALEHRLFSRLSRYLA